MTAPFIHPRRLERIFSPRRDTPRAAAGRPDIVCRSYWPEAYKPDPIELLRESVRENAHRKGQRIALLLNLLCWGVIVGCVWLIVSGSL